MLSLPSNRRAAPDNTPILGQVIAGIALVTPPARRSTLHAGRTTTATDPEQRCGRDFSLQLGNDLAETDLRFGIET